MLIFTDTLQLVGLGVGLPKLPLQLRSLVLKGLEILLLDQFNLLFLLGRLLADHGQLLLGRVLAFHARGDVSEGCVEVFLQLLLFAHDFNVLFLHRPRAATANRVSDLLFHLSAVGRTTTLCFICLPSVTRANRVSGSEPTLSFVDWSKRSREPRRAFETSPLSCFTS